MKTFTILIITTGLVLNTIAAPASFQKLQVKRGPEGSSAEPHSYIVVLKPGAPKGLHLSDIVHFNTTSEESDLSWKYKDDFGGALNGYAAVLRGPILDQVLADDRVAYVQEDTIVSVPLPPNEPEEEDDIAAQHRRELHAQFMRGIKGRGGDGSGVDIYSLDTGIRTSHIAFGGRAVWGKTFGPYKDADGHGHGTHTAGTAVGAFYGVATGAKVIAVKVLGDSNTGPVSDIIAGIAWVVESAKASGRPSIMTMSLTMDFYDPLDSAVSNAINSGVHVTVAAGNSNKDATAFSPARVGGGNIIGAVDKKNKKASFSNFGFMIDCWAPGVNIISASHKDDLGTQIMSGTSQATPFVAGLLAVAIQSHGNKSPNDLANDLRKFARPVVGNVPTGSTNKLCTRW